MKPHTGLALVAVLAALACPSTAAAGRHERCPGARLRPKRSNIVTVTKATTCLINRLRRARHLRTLRFSRTLTSIAAGQSDDMLVGHYFGDNSLSGRTPLARVIAARHTRGRAIAVAQNIAWATPRRSTPAAVVSAWMHSPPHREILLGRRYREVGIGVRQGTPTGRRRGAVYTADLATG